MRFIDLFAGLGGFHHALRALGHECVFASEVNEELRELYAKNLGASKIVFGDIRVHKKRVPKHDILCAGFPCQPFSKSGFQNGTADKTRGTLFHEILEVVRAHEPRYVLLENVGNFERHDGGQTWRTVRESLQALNYNVVGTEHKASGGHGLVSPHHFGHPHTRERFFVVASKDPLVCDPFPPRREHSQTSLASIIQAAGELSALERAESTLPHHYIESINHWNKFLAAIPAPIELPSFPIWADEFGARYPYEGCTPSSIGLDELRRKLRVSHDLRPGRAELLLRLPPYARSEERRFPKWKEDFIRQNRVWHRSIAPYVPVGWKVQLNRFLPSFRKLEWNCKGEERNLWLHVLQFRPSGLRAKRFKTSPALVAMTTSQIPILGPHRRFITRTEGLRLQGFPDAHALPRAYDDAFRALGNAVHVEVVKAIALVAFGDETATGLEREAA